MDGLTSEARTLAVAALADGNSIRGTARIVNVGRNIIMRLGLQVGEGCIHLHNRLVRDVRAYVLSCDETWSFITKKAARVDPVKDPATWGDVYTFYGFDDVSKLIVSWYCGKRDQPSTDTFIADLRSRIAVMPQLSTDGFVPYIEAIAAQFMGAVDYGQVIKQYGSKRQDDHRYEPSRVTEFIQKKAIYGAPEMERLSTSRCERLNLTMRHTVGRTRRLCLAFSKTLQGHVAATALGVMAYNFCKINRTIETTPAVAAKLASRPWTIAELVDAALAERPIDRPEPQRLELPPGRDGNAAPAARQLPNGGWLRAVPAGSGGDAPGPAPSPVTPPAAPAVAASGAPAGDPRQMDLLAWRPRPLPPPGTQLDLFGGEPPKGGAS